MSITELLQNTKPEITVREQSPTESYPELKANQVLTRYFTHEEKTYLVFEPKPQELVIG